MSWSKDPTLLRSIIIDHYDHPHKKVNEAPNDYVKLQNKSSTCIDDITVYIKHNSKTIEDILFSGIGCAISTSSTDIMAKLLTNKTFNEALIILDNYLNMVNGQPYDEELLDELIAFYRINEQSNRIKCAKIGINAIYNCIKEINNNEIQ